MTETTQDLAAKLLAALQSDEGEDWLRTAGHREKPQRERRRRVSWDLHRGDVRVLGV